MKNLNLFRLRTCFVILILALNGCATTSLVDQGMQYSNPAWAPAYYPGVRYYYIPDIETYYDLSTRDFVYLDNGQWLFSRTLPSFYNGYDLYNGYVIALDRDVFQPWMHHQFYVSNYPRFYYRSVYNNTEIPNIKGFNENQRKPVYWKQEDRERMNVLRRNENTENKPVISRPPQNSNYYGRRIGQPVRVQPHMRENREGSHERRRD